MVSFKGCPKRITAECNRDNFLFDYANGHHFGQFQWCESKLSYTIYRAVFFAYYFSWLVLSGDDGYRAPDKAGVYFIYLTHWSFILLNAHLLMSLVVAIFLLVKERKNQLPVEYPITVFIKLNWIIQVIAQDAAVIVTVAYWALVYKPDGQPIHATNIHIHALNTAYVILDTFVSASPWRLLHFWLPQCYGVIYAVFSGVYWAAGGVNENGQRYIYQALDYTKSPNSAAVMIVLIVVLALPIIHCVFFGIYKIRIKIHANLSKRRAVAPATGVAIAVIDLANKPWQNQSEFKQQTDIPNGTTAVMNPVYGGVEP